MRRPPQRGTSATERFQAATSDAADTPPERLNALIREVLPSVHETIRGNDVTYPEYDALKARLIQVGRDGEWPPFVEEFATADRHGSKGSNEGPFYVPGAPELPAEATLPMRNHGRGVAPTTDHSGRSRIRTIKPTPYLIPTDGATGALIRAAGWHASQSGAPAYLKVTAPRIPAHDTQLYFPGDPHNGSDIGGEARADAGADPGPRRHRREYDLVLDAV